MRKWPNCVKNNLVRVKKKEKKKKVEQAKKEYYSSTDRKSRVAALEK